MFLGRAGLQCSIVFMAESIIDPGLEELLLEGCAGLYQKKTQRMTTTMSQPQLKSLQPFTPANTLVFHYRKL